MIKIIEFKESVIFQLTEEEKKACDASYFIISANTLDYDINVREYSIEDVFEWYYSIIDDVEDANLADTLEEAYSIASNTSYVNYR